MSPIHRSCLSLCLIAFAVLSAERPAAAGFIADTVTFTDSRGTANPILVGARTSFFPFLGFRVAFAPNGGPGTPGSLSLTANATLTAQFPDQLSAPGIVSIALGRTAGTLTYRELEGAELNVTIDPFNIQPDPTKPGPIGRSNGVLFDSSLQNVLAPLGTVLTSNTIATINNPFTTIGIDGLLAVGLDPAFRRVETITLNEILFDLEAENRQTGTIVTAGGLGFNQFTSDVNIDLDLPEAGTWDFSLTDLVLSGELTKADGFGLRFHIEILFQSPIDEFLELAGPGLANEIPFAATATSQTAGTFQDWFSIEVLQPQQVDVVPEPSSLALLAVGAICCLACCCRRRQAT